MKPESGSAAGRTVFGQRVADLGVGYDLDAGRDEADLARPQAARRQRLGREHTHALDDVGGAGCHHADLGTGLDLAFAHAHQNDDAQIGVVPAVHQQRLERRLGIALGRRQALDQRFQHAFDVDAGLGADLDRVGSVEADHLLDLFLDALWLGRGQVDLVEDRDDLVVVFDRLVDIGERLRLDTLAGVHHKQRAFARRQRPADLVSEVDVAGRVHQVELVGLPILGGIDQPDRLRLDGDATLALDIHAVEHLVAHLAGIETAAELDQPVGQGGLPMVDVGDDGEIADQAEVGHLRSRGVRAFTLGT